MCHPFLYGRAHTGQPDNPTERKTPSFIARSLKKVKPCVQGKITAPALSRQKGCGGAGFLPAPPRTPRRRPALPRADPAVPSAKGPFTSVFGMGTGVSSPLLATGKKLATAVREGRGARRGAGQARQAPAGGRRGPILAFESEVRNGQASRRFSTGPLSASPRLHARPIEAVFFGPPSGHLRGGRASLGAGLALRCFQRLSFPGSATRLRRWRDGRSTVGRSPPVLSY